MFAVTLICGLLSIISAFLEKAKKETDKNSNGYRNICVSCGNILNVSAKDVIVCPQCGGEIEEIKGVMDRHPELLKNIKGGS